MPSQKNIENLKQLKQYLREYKSFVVVDCSGLDVDSVNKFRRDLESAGSIFKISKNRLIKLALMELNENKLPIAENWLQGPSGLVLIKDEDDPIAPMKVLNSFRQNKEGKPGIKGVFLFGDCRR